jgi:coenzyme Q-binding protein COQ10
MPSFNTSRRVKHSPQDMFDLVADVDAYPQFVPLCQALIVRRRSVDALNRDILVADMTVAYKLLRETFASRVTLDRAALKIDVEYLDGPFSHLKNQWTFLPDDNGGCQVGFFIDYQFRSRTLALVMGAVFDTAFRRFADAFERRADQIYGRRRLEPAAV